MAVDKYLELVDGVIEVRYPYPLTTLDRMLLTLLFLKWCTDNPGQGMVSVAESDYTITMSELFTAEEKCEITFRDGWFWLPVPEGAGQHIATRDLLDLCSRQPHGLEIAVGKFLTYDSTEQAVYIQGFDEVPVKLNYTIEGNKVYWTETLLKGGTSRVQTCTASFTEICRERLDALKRERERNLEARTQAEERKLQSLINEIEKNNRLRRDYDRDDDLER